MGILQRTTEEFKNDVYKKHGNKVKILSDYNGATKPVKILYRCKKHGDVNTTINAKNIFSPQFQPCKECNSEKRKADDFFRSINKNVLYDELKKIVESKGGVLISKEWTRSKDLYEIDCGNNEHPNFFNSADKIMNSNLWCPFCYGRRGDFQGEINSLIESKNSELLSKYTNSKNHVKIKCKEHDYVWEMMPLNIKKGRWCPVCNLPYSEKVVYDYLKNNNYEFDIQYTFDDLRGNNNEKFRYDFAILKDNKLLGLLEIDDESHNRLDSIMSDKIKNNYCKDKNIKLLRIDIKRNKKEFKNYDWYYNYINENLKDYLLELTK